MAFDAGMAAPLSVQVRLFKGRPFATDIPYTLRLDGMPVTWPNPPQLWFGNNTSIQLQLSPNKKEATGTADKAFTDTLLSFGDVGLVEINDPVTGRVWGKGRYFFETSVTAGGAGVVPLGGTLTP